MSVDTGTKVQPKKGKDPIVFFPVCLLKNASEDISSACYDILCLIGYDYARHYDKGESVGNRMFYAGMQKINFGFQDTEADYYRGEDLYSKLDFKYPKVNIEASKLVSMLGSSNSNFEAACFLAYCALRSIIQSDPYKDISTAFLVSRMLGSATTIKGMIDEHRKINPDKLPAELVFLSKRYWIEKLKKELQYQYGVTIFSAKHYHKTFYSFHLNYKDLKKKADARRKLSKLNPEEIEEALLLKSKPNPNPIPVFNPSENTGTSKTETWTEFTGSQFDINIPSKSKMEFNLEIQRVEAKYGLFKHSEDYRNFSSYWSIVMTNGKGEYKRLYELEKNWNMRQSIIDWLNSDKALDSKNYKSFRSIRIPPKII